MTQGHVFIATSLDGFIARPDGNIDWLIERDAPEEDHGYNDFIKNIDGIVMGRGTYEKALTFGSWPYDRPVVVATKTLSSIDIPAHLAGKVRFVNASPASIMDQLQKDGWQHAYIDGGQVIQSWLREGLIDSMVVTTVPVLIGRGLPLFGMLAKDLSLRHIATKTFPSGLVQSKYEVTK